MNTRPEFRNFLSSPLTIDLSRQKGSERWREVIDRESDTARKIFDAAWKDFPSTARGLACCGGSWLFGELYRGFDAPYQSEIDAWARAMKRGFGVVAMANCSYELEQLRESLSGFWKKPLQNLFGCTAGIVSMAGGEAVHVRTLDWPITGMGRATRLFEFTNGVRKFVAVGFPGAVGVLSGMVPKAYSVTINWAPPQQMPSFETAPSFLLRKTLEKCDTYEEAVARLTRTKLCTSVFYTVCGARENEGCVIERTPDDFLVRELRNGIVVQSNHHDDDGWFEPCNGKLASLKKQDALVRSTRDRRKVLELELSQQVNQSWSHEKVLFEALDRDPVTNYETCQRMIFRPRTGQWFLQTSI